LLVNCGQRTPDLWKNDFKNQQLSVRPALEVNYTDSSRTAFQILAEKYLATGQLKAPHLLTGDKSEPWLWMEVENEKGVVYSTKYSEEPSRISLYRRGPYFCEVHWFDLQPVTEDGEIAPLKGDLTLYCYPEKMLAEITWHGTGDFNGKKLKIKGISPVEFDVKKFEEGTKQSFSFPLFGEEKPMPNSAFSTIEGAEPLRYSTRKGYYVIGTVTTESFQEQFYDIPNRYETATFSITNDSVPRKIYICHESSEGGAIVEGGAVLNHDGQSMPIVVQVSKNFDGEKEEKFYNPFDTAFSETFFPLYLEPYETVNLSSLHLYQNWGRHMTKHWSSLGAWMDYFHSSTGVTETTCYVPFKFAGIGGVAIADFRAMSQETFWRGQPQHDNLAGHSFLSFYDGKNWQHSKYESTIYRSTGPNWYDIQMNYISADSSIRITADIWETPQTDELRSFFNVRYEVLKPLVIEDAQANFRLLSITSVIQQLRFGRFAANGVDDIEIDFSKSPFPVKGLKLPSENAYLAEYGDHERERGSNAVVIRKFSGPDGIGPAATIQTGAYKERFKQDRGEDTRLLLVPDVERLELNTGDVFSIDGFWLPYGDLDNAETPRREAAIYGNGVPKVVSCSIGKIVSDLPVKIEAEKNRAEFSIKGGKDLLPVIVSGLTDWRFPRIWKKEGDKWRLLSHARNTAHDGYQVFCEKGGTFGAVFLVASDENEQVLRVSAGKPVEEGEKIKLGVANSIDGILPLVTMLDHESESRLSIAYPAAHAENAGKNNEAVKWKSSEGGSLWFESDEGKWERGGRLSPNQDDIDLEYWWQNNKENIEHISPEFLIDLKGTRFEDPEGERTWILTDKGWEKVNSCEENSKNSSGVIAVASPEGDKFICMAWPKSCGVINGSGKIGVKLKPIDFPISKRYHIRGKIYMVECDLEVLKDRILKETNVF
jgi:hypothetical protein